MTDKNLIDKAKSLLLGLAVGDALGVPVEFLARGSFHVDGMTGYGTHNQPLGTWSDDTSLTLCLAASIAEGFDINGLARHFVRWYDEGYLTATGVVFDVGNTTAWAIRRLKEGIAPKKSGSTAFKDNGNGSLMRVAPLVFVIAGKPEKPRFAAAKAVSAITHAHPISVAACFIYLEYLHKLLIGADKAAAYAALRGDFRDGSPFIAPDILNRFVRVLQFDITTLSETEIRSGGFVIDTLEAALWCFLTTNNYRDAVLKAVNLGEDTDTTAAVAGGLAGLFYSAGNIPPDWLKTLAAFDDISRLAVDMANAVVE
jgi:ADP-ribosylglycohydrolase